MPISAERLIELHPYLYHVSIARDIGTIQKHGLLSTSNLLDLCGYSEDDRTPLEARPRSKSVGLTSSDGTVFCLNDQIPLDFDFQGCLPPGISCEDWLRDLNSRVFFWTTEARCNKFFEVMRSRNYECLVLKMRTADLLEHFGEKVEVNPYNSGAPYKPNPAKREPFRSLADFDFDRWKRNRNLRDIVVEITVRGSMSRPDLLTKVLDSQLYTQTRGSKLAILVVGSVAFDTIETPHGKREKVLGGAATYFALSASNFTDVRVIGVVGEDFGPRQQSVFDARKIDTTGIEHAKGLSFHWTGSYTGQMNEATTLGTDLNVFATFAPKIPASYVDSEYLFLANIDPKLQAHVRAQMTGVRMACGDTMNYWIADHRAALDEVLKTLDVLLINDGEACLLSGETNLVRAAEKIIAMGPKALVVKHGEYGATAFFGPSLFASGTGKQHPFRAPALPLGEVIDPTGAGDSFAGGFYGYIASQPALTPAVFRRALFYGGVMGSFAVEKFGTERLQTVTKAEIEERFQLFVQISHLTPDEDELFVTAAE